MIKTIAGLQGVTILGRDAQKKIGGGSTCGIIVTVSGSSARYVLYTPDENGNGLTKDEARASAASSNDIFNSDGSGSYVSATGNWCCDSCNQFQSPPLA